MPRLVLPVSRATPFHIIHLSNTKGQAKDSLGRVLPTALRRPTPFILHHTSVNNGFCFPLWSRFFHPLLATRYLFGISLCYRLGLVAAAVPGEGGGEQPNTRVYPFSRGLPRFLCFVNHKVLMSPRRISWSYTATNHHASFRY